MTFTIKQFLGLAALALTLTGFVLGQSRSDDKDLPNFFKVNANLYRGGQPTETGIKQLAKMGVKTIVDLRKDDRRARNEEKWAMSAGIRFINLPLSNWFGPTYASIANVLVAIDDKAGQPVFIHCKLGSDRTGTMIAVYRISHQGWTGEQAIAEAKKFGMGWWQLWMKAFINDYYRDHIGPNPLRVT